jgi:hypothetical protein
MIATQPKNSRQQRHYITLDTYILVNKLLREGKPLLRIAEDKRIPVSYATLHQHFSKKGVYYFRTRDKFQPLVERPQQPEPPQEKVMDLDLKLKEEPVEEIATEPTFDLDAWNRLEGGKVIYDDKGTAYNVIEVCYAAFMSRKMAKGFKLVHKLQDGRTVDTITDDYHAFYPADPTKVETGRAFRIHTFGKDWSLRVGETIVRISGLKSEIVTGLGNGVEIEIDGTSRLFIPSNYYRVEWL